MLAPLLADLAVARLGPGRPRTRPDALLGDKAYSSRAIRDLLRAKRVKTVIPQPSDQIAHRQRRGSAGGRPPAFDADDLQGPQRDRAILQRPQAMARPGHPLRQARRRLPRRRRPPRHHHLATRIRRHALTHRRSSVPDGCGHFQRRGGAMTILPAAVFDYSCAIVDPCLQFMDHLRDRRLHPHRDYRGNGGVSPCDTTTGASDRSGGRG